MTFDFDFLDRLESELQVLSAREAPRRRAGMFAPTRRVLLVLVVLVAGVSLCGAVLAAGFDPTGWFTQSGGPTGGSLTSATFHVDLGTSSRVLGAVPVTLDCSGDGQEQTCSAASSASAVGRAYELLTRAGASDGSTGPADLTGPLDPATLTGHDQAVALMAAVGQPSPSQSVGLPPFIACVPAADAWLCRPLVDGSTLSGGAPVYQDALGQPKGPSSTGGSP